MNIRRRQSTSRTDIYQSHDSPTRLHWYIYIATQGDDVDVEYAAGTLKVANKQSVMFPKILDIYNRRKGFQDYVDRTFSFDSVVN